jgi:hypothetical protein
MALTPATTLKSLRDLPQLVMGLVAASILPPVDVEPGDYENIHARLYADISRVAPSTFRHNRPWA